MGLLNDRIGHLFNVYRVHYSCIDCKELENRALSKAGWGDYILFQ